LLIGGSLPNFDRRFEMRALILSTAAALSFLAAPVSAAEVIGDTTGEPTWNRPIGSGPSLSGVGTATPYDVISFNVDAAGDYVFSLTSAFDNYLHLYQGSFDPNNQLANLLIGDDDGGGGLNASFNFGLLSGTSYFAIVSGFSNNSFGAYNLAITGPGNVSIGGAVPEPTTWAMMLLGFGLIGGAMRRKKSKQKVTVSYA
jgi:hypothetical protein